MGLPAADWLKFRPVDPAADPDNLVSAIEGSVTTDSATITLVADRTGLLPDDLRQPTPGAYTAAIEIRSNGLAGADPVRCIQVTMNVAPLQGEYEVLAKIDTINGSRADTHNPRLALSLYDDRDGLKGVIDHEKTLLMPERLRMTGSLYEDGTIRFTVSGSLELPAGHVDNPYPTGSCSGGDRAGQSCKVDKDCPPFPSHTCSDTGVRRDITLIGDRATAGDAFLGPLDIKGEYYETIRNVLDTPIVMSGTFTAQRVSADASPDLVETNDFSGDVISYTNTNPDRMTIQTLKVSQRLLITGVTVAIDISHSRPLDLIATLQSPGGGDCSMTPAAGCARLRYLSTAGVGRVLYDVEAETQPEGDMANFIELFSNGDWTLAIEDTLDGENGMLNSWELFIDGTEVHSVEGTITGVPTGSEVLLTGCGLTRNTVTDVSGGYRFDDIIDCVYQVRVVAADFVQESSEVIVSGSDRSGVDLVPGMMTFGTLVDPELPCETDTTGDGMADIACPAADFRFIALTTNGGAGLEGIKSGEAGMAGGAGMAPDGIHGTTQVGNEDAFDSATFDIDRRPYAADLPMGHNCGANGICAEDSNGFLAQVDAMAGTNQAGVNATIDGPMENDSQGSPIDCGPPTPDPECSKSYRIQVNIGHPFIGRAVSGDTVLTMGASL